MERLVLGYGPENQNKFMKWLGMEDPNWRKMMLTLLGIVFGLILLISILLTLRYRAPRPDKAAILYRNFVRKSGVSLAIGESPSAFAARARNESVLDEDSIDEVTDAYLAARYGSPDPGSLELLSQRVNQL